MEESSCELRTMTLDFHRTLTDFVRQYQSRNRVDLGYYGVTISQCHLLETLSESGPLSMQELASRLCLQISTVTRLVDGMVRKRLVKRKKDARDRRVVRVELTDGGRRAYKKIAADLLSREEEILAPLSIDVRRGVVDAVNLLLQSVAPPGRSSLAQ